MGVVENDSRGVEFLREVDAVSETQPLSLCPCRYPRESKVGDKMVVIVESTDVAMAARKEHFNNSPPVALERNMLKELPRLVAGYCMTRPSHVTRTIRRDIKPYRRINCIPKSEIGDIHAKLVEPRREVPRQKRSAREAEEEYFS